MLHSSGDLWLCFPTGRFLSLSLMRDDRRTRAINGICPYGGLPPVSFEAAAAELPDLTDGRIKGTAVLDVTPA